MPQQRTIEEYQNGVLISTTPYTVSDAQLRAEAAELRLRQGRAQLRQDMQDAAAAAANTNLPAGTRQMAAISARTIRAILDLELVLAYQDDDGAE